MCPRGADISDELPPGAGASRTDCGGTAPPVPSRRTGQDAPAAQTAQNARAACVPAAQGASGGIRKPCGARADVRPWTACGVPPHPPEAEPSPPDNGVPQTSGGAEAPGEPFAPVLPSGGVFPAPGVPHDAHEPEFSEPSPVFAGAPGSEDPPHGDAPAHGASHASEVPASGAIPGPGAAPEPPHDAEASPASGEPADAQPSAVHVGSAAFSVYAAAPPPGSGTQPDAETGGFSPESGVSGADDAVQRGAAASPGSAPNAGAGISGVTGGVSGTDGHPEADSFGEKSVRAVSAGAGAHAAPHGRSSRTAGGDTDGAFEGVAASGGNAPGAAVFPLTAGAAFPAADDLCTASSRADARSGTDAGSPAVFAGGPPLSADGRADAAAGAVCGTDAECPLCADGSGRGVSPPNGGYRPSASGRSGASPSAESMYGGDTPHSPCGGRYCGGSAESPPGSSLSGGIGP